MSIKNMMRIVFLTIGLSIVISLLAVFQLKTLTQEVDNLANIRYLSYQAADELRQSSDDLTRLGRTYVVSGDDKYEKMYMDILDIRNGKKPRPENYHTIYWDLVLEYGQKPKPDGSKSVLLETMKNLGFTQDELNLLQEAGKNSDVLVSMEVRAMNAMKGLFSDSNGDYTVRSDPDPKMAIKLLHSNQYHIEKAKIVAPIDNFFKKLEARTNKQFETVSSEAQTVVIFSTTIMSIVLMVAIIGYLVVTKKITIRISHMADSLKTIDEKSDLTIRVDSTGSNEISRIGLGINKLITSYSKTIVKINTVNSFIETSSKNIQSISDDNIEMSNKHTQELIMATTAMEEMTLALTGVSKNTSTAEIYAADTEKAVISGKKIFDKSSQEFSTLAAGFDKTVVIINELAEETNLVSNVLEVIKAIADQTNLLALNAAIEAARAGDQGRGFAVVADEVRSLAQRTQESTVEIETMISNLQDKAKQSMETLEQSTQKINSTSESFSSANDSLTKIQTAASEIYIANKSIASATEEQLAVSDDISHNLMSIKEVSGNITSNINLLDPSVTSMLSNVNELKQAIVHLSVE